MERGGSVFIVNGVGDPCQCASARGEERRAVARKLDTGDDINGWMQERSSGVGVMGSAQVSPLRSPS